MTELYPNDGWLDGLLPAGEDALYSVTLDAPRELSVIATWNDDGSARLCFHVPAGFLIRGRRLFLCLGDLNEATFTCCNIRRRGTFTFNILPRRTKAKTAGFATKRDVETRFPERLGLNTARAIAVDAPVLAQGFMRIECEGATVVESDFSRVNVYADVRRIYAYEGCEQEFNYMFSPDGYLKTLGSALGRPLPELGFTVSEDYIYFDRDDEK